MRPDDVCALCDRPIDPDAAGWDSPSRLSSYWNPGMLFGRRRSATVHYGCAYLGNGQYDRALPVGRPFEETPMFRALAAWHSGRPFLGWST